MRKRIYYSFLVIKKTDEQSNKLVIIASWVTAIATVILVLVSIGLAVFAGKAAKYAYEANILQAKAIFPITFTLTLPNI